MSDVKSASKTEGESFRRMRKPYQAPSLTQLGTLREMTLGEAGGSDDGPGNGGESL
jgi:hypothetical protein